MISKNAIVIGGGPAGILATRHLKRIIQVKGFQVKSDFGGAWNFSQISQNNHPDLKNDPFYKLYGSLPSSLYSYLISNLPKYNMQFKDFPLKQSTSMFMPYSQFKQYIDNYCKHFQLQKNYQFNRLIVNVKKNKSEDGKKFIVKHVSAIDGSDQREETADYVFVCNGHFSTPFIPNIKGIQNYQGNLFHTHTYRKPQASLFDKKTVVLLGSRSSAFDIILQLLYNKQVTQKIKIKKLYVVGTVNILQKSTDLLENIHKKVLVLKKGRLLRVGPKKTVVFQDQTTDQVDTIVYATGYKYNIPFLEQSDNLIEWSEQKRYFGPLYHKIFCINQPNLIFIGLIQKSPVLLHIFQRQVLVAIQLILGKLTLPPKQQMLQQLQKQLKFREEHNEGRDKYFYFNQKYYSSFDYTKQLSQLIGVKESQSYQKVIKPVALKLQQFIRQSGNIIQFRKHNYSQYIPKDFEWTSKQF